MKQILAASTCPFRSAVFAFQESFYNIAALGKQVLLTGCVSRGGLSFISLQKMLSSSVSTK